MSIFDAKIVQFGLKRLHFFFATSKDRQGVFRVYDGNNLIVEYLPLRAGYCYEASPDGVPRRAWVNDHTKHIEIPGIEGSVLPISNRSSSPLQIGMAIPKEKTDIVSSLESLAAVESYKALSRLNENQNKLGTNARLIQTVLIILGIITVVNLLFAYFVSRSG